jgi:hypothetical protein
LNIALSYDLEPWHNQWVLYKLQDKTSRTRVVEVARGFAFRSAFVYVCANQHYELIFYDANGDGLVEAGTGANLLISLDSEVLQFYEPFQNYVRFYLSPEEFIYDTLIDSDYIAPTLPPTVAPTEDPDEDGSDDDDDDSAGDIDDSENQEFSISNYLPHIVGGGVAGLVCIALVIYFVCKPSAKRKNRASQAASQPAAVAVAGGAVAGAAVYGYGQGMMAFQGSDGQIYMAQMPASTGSAAAVPGYYAPQAAVDSSGQSMMMVQTPYGIQYVPAQSGQLATNAYAPGYPSYAAGGGEFVNPTPGAAEIPGASVPDIESQEPVQKHLSTDGSLAHEVPPKSD